MLLGAFEFCTGFRGRCRLFFAANLLLMGLLSAHNLVRPLQFQILLWTFVALLVGWFLYRFVVRLAYNFNVVVPGRLYRSAKPDSFFFLYVKYYYDIQQVVSLIGPVRGHTTAARLGIKVHSFSWRGPPALSDMQAALALLDNGKPTLVHCRAGRDRTGLLIAAHRMTRSAWPRERAIAEMSRFGHDPKEKREFHIALDAVSAAQAPLC
jgi:hypothetical protein